MADYPDWTDLVQIVGTDIMVAVDLQAAYIMMPVDIQAQYVDLTVDIVAQTVGNITVDIAAQTVGNIGIDLKAQSVGNITIDVETQSVGIYLKADWEVLQGTDKNEYGYATVGAEAEAIVLDYTVPAGKTFYICQWGFGVLWNGGVIAKLSHVHNATVTYLSVAGGYSGGTQSFTKPIAVLAGYHIKVYIINMDSGGAHTGYGSIGGYEI